MQTNNDYCQSSLSFAAIHPVLNIMHKLQTPKHFNSEYANPNNKPKRDILKSRKFWKMNAICEEDDCARCYRKWVEAQHLRKAPRVIKRFSL